MFARNQSSGEAMKPMACRDGLSGGAFRGFELNHNAARHSGAERKAQRKAFGLCGAAFPSPRFHGCLPLGGLSVLLTPKTRNDCRMNAPD